MAKTPVAIDIFSGAGGLTEGFLSAGVNVAVAVEKHPHAALTHAFNHPGTRIICGDICELTSRDVLAAVKSQTGKAKVDIVAGGPPCQGFSTAGKQSSRDPRNKLVHEFIRLVSELTPECFVFENVPAMVAMSSGKIIRTLLDSIWDMGYSVYGIDNQSDYYPETYPVVDASWFGVPQKRKRLILVGWRTKFDSFQWLKATSEGLSSRRRTDPVTIHEAIGDLDFLDAGFESHTYLRKASTAYQQARRAKSTLLFNHLASNHKAETVEMFSLFKPGSTVRSIPEQSRTGKQRVKRFAKWELADAILALPDDYIHYSKHRIPTVRELARLQSFDDNFVFLGKRTTSSKNRRLDVPQYTQVGNAVPPLLARSLAKAILKVFGASTKDLRDIKARIARQNQLLGSSAFSGYEIPESLAQSLDIYDINSDWLDFSTEVGSYCELANRKPQHWAYSAAA